MDVTSCPQVEIQTSHEFSGSLDISVSERDIDRLASGAELVCDADDFTVKLTPPKRKPKPREDALLYLQRTYRPQTAWEAEVFGGLARV